jgi:hypothetical protein
MHWDAELLMLCTRNKWGLYPMQPDGIGKGPRLKSSADPQNGSNNPDNFRKEFHVEG